MADAPTLRSYMLYPGGKYVTVLDDLQFTSMLFMILIEPPQRPEPLSLNCGAVVVGANVVSGNGVVALVACGKTADATTGSALPPATPNTTTTETTLAPNLLSDVIVVNSVDSAPTSEPTPGSALESANIGSTNSTNSTDTPITTPAATPNATATPEPTPESTTTTPAPTTTTPGSLALLQATNLKHLWSTMKIRSTNMAVLDEKEDIKMLLVKKRKLLIGCGVLLVVAIAGVSAGIGGSVLATRMENASARHGKVSRVAHYHCVWTLPQSAHTKHPCTIRDSLQIHGHREMSNCGTGCNSRKKFKI
ncbi:hypothetical protein AC1031_003430 [Aphanomyces cochlioides]|nr:hypothetical protein AC1031_003430 [Aphanomyces cochlioides]